MVVGDVGDVSEIHALSIIIVEVYKFVSTMHIQNVPGRKVNVLGGHSIGHSNQTSVYVHVSEIVIPLYSCKIVDKKEILRTVCNTGIYCSSDSLV
jgi:hypothetical protein